MELRRGEAPRRQRRAARWARERRVLCRSARRRRLKKQLGNPTRRSARKPEDVFGAQEHRESREQRTQRPPLGVAPGRLPKRRRPR